jgi:DNA-binding SARP family transcriptional activator
MTAVRIAGALAWFWYSGVPWSEARARTRDALAAADAEGVPDAARPPADQAALAELLYPISGLAFFGGEPDHMLALSARAEPLWGAVDAARAADPDLDRALRVTAVRGRATMTGMSGLAHAMLGASDVAVGEMTAAIRVADEGGDRWWHAVLLQRRALVAAWGGRVEPALVDYAASVGRLRALGDTWFLSLGLEGMAAAELARGDLPAAAGHARESVAVLADEPDPWFISRSLDQLAAIAMAGGSPSPGRAAEAARLLGAASALRARRGAEVIGPDRDAHARTLAAAQAVLGPDFVREWDVGAALDLAGAIALAAAADVAPEAAPRAAPGGGATVAPVGAAPALPTAEAPAPTAYVAEAPAAAAAVEVLTFGPLAVTRDGIALSTAEITPAKARELLLYLALHGPRTKEQIALALWPDASPAQVRNIFHVTMHQLRRILGRKDAVAFDGRVYALARPAGPRRADGPASGREDGVVVLTDVDAVLEASAAARRAERELARRGGRGAEAADAAGADAAALDAWRGALDRAHRGPLGGDDGADAWLAEHQARVGAAWGEGMEALARLHALRDAPAEAAAALEALVAGDPLREAAHRALMACYAAAGEPARALARYAALAAGLEREIGVEPARETRALAAAIRGRSAAAGAALAMC